MEEWIKRKKMRYSLYLNTGNMLDILDIPPWEINEIIEFSNQRNKDSGGSVRPLTSYEKDMIERAKNKGG